MPEPAPPESTLTYETPQPYGNAPILVKLAAIFGFVAAGLDLLGVALAVIMLVTVFWVMGQMNSAPAPGGAATPLGPRSVMWLTLAIRGGGALLGIISAAVKTVAGIQLLRHSRRAWGWGLASGIIGSIPLTGILTCGVICLGTLPAGVFTLVVMLLGHVRRFLADAEAR